MAFRFSELCVDNCLERGGPGQACTKCRSGYKGDDCCECDGDLEKDPKDGNCKCLNGKLRGKTNTNKCIPCRDDQIVGPDDKCTCEDGKFETLDECLCKFILVVQFVKGDIYTSTLPV